MKLEKSLLLASTLFLFLVATLAAACGSNSGGNQNGDVAGVIANNHGHVAVLTKAQLDAGAAVQLDIQGSAAHRHTLDLTAPQVTAVKDGTQVKVTSSNNSLHSHEVTFN